MFQPAVGYKANLKTKLLPDDAVLPLYPNDAARLAELLPAPDDYTRLWVGDGVTHEVVKVTSVTDGAVIIERGEEGTRERTAPLGSCVSFVWTALNLADFVQQGFGGIMPAVCDVVAGSGRVTVTKADCVVTVDRPTCEGATWRAGNAEFVQDESGCIAATPLTTQIADGEYVNATVTIRDGEIIAIKSGTNIVYSGGGCCSGGSAQTAFAAEQDVAAQSQSVSAADGSWSLSQDPVSNALYVVGPVGAQFSVEAGGAVIVPLEQIPESGRWSGAVGSGRQPGIAFIRSGGVYVGTGAVVI